MTMATHIIQIEKHKFICGLFWQSLSQPRTLEKEAMELAKKIDSDLFVLRKDHTTVQAGFAQTRDGARRTMYSLGAAVSKTLALEGAVYDDEKQPVHNWLGAFKLPDGMWAYFAVRDANFLPNGDFAGTQQEVLDRLNGDYGLGGWNIVIGDPELAAFGFHNFTPKRIEEMLPHKPNGQIRTHVWWSLQPVERKLPWRPLAGGAALLVLVAAGGCVYWKQLQHNKEEEQRMRAIEAARARMLGKAPQSALPHPWQTKPLPAMLTQACLDHFEHFTPGGWQLDEFVCTGTEARYAWSRNGSIANFLLEAVPAATVDPNGEKATLTIALKMGLGSNEALHDAKSLLPSIVSRLQLLRIAPRVTLQRPPAPPPPQGVPGMQNAPPPRPDWQTYSFAFRAAGLPLTEVAAALGQPGVRLDRLSYRSGAWFIEGAMYAN